MKKIVKLFLFVLGLSGLLEAGTPSLSLQTTSDWKDYGTATLSAKQKEKSVLAKTLTFRSNRAITLKEINFLWRGKPLTSIDATLYTNNESKPNTPLLLIEKNVASDGRWHKDSQKLSFAFDETLIASHTYYLVLSFPPEEETHLKEGRFILPKKDSIILELSQ